MLGVDGRRLTTHTARACRPIVPVVLRGLAGVLSDSGLQTKARIILYKTYSRVLEGLILRCGRSQIHILMSFARIIVGIS